MHEPDPCFYYIQSGSVEICTIGFAGDEEYTIIKNLSNGDSFGEYSFISGKFFNFVINSKFH